MSSAQTSMQKLFALPSVVELGEHMPTELWRGDDEHRLVLRAFNEGGFGSTDVDLLDLVEWLATDARAQSLLDNSGYAISARHDRRRHKASP
jgi:hypothetical protein